MGLHQGHHQCLSSRPWTSLPYPGSQPEQNAQRVGGIYNHDFLPEGRVLSMALHSIFFYPLCSEQPLKGPFRGWECLGGRVRCRWEAESQAAPLRGEQSREEGKRTNQKTVTGAASPPLAPPECFPSEKKKDETSFPGAGRCLRTNVCLVT